VSEILKQINSETAEAEASEKITDENKENEPLATPIKLNIRDSGNPCRYGKRGNRDTNE